MVTSLRTPRPEIIKPHRMIPEIDICGDMFTNVEASWFPTPARFAASVAQAASRAVIPRPKMVPSNAVDVLAENPWAK
ncbi:hypothetical protein PJL18_02671 [Paenarthrobacter nicotinovorans]|nr:hypothetical protein [Paenarthrobacter nicotinovorans]